MKEKIYKVIGEVCVHFIKYGVAVLVISLISTLIFDIKKEEIWLETSDYFQSFYDNEKQELYNKFGIVDEYEVDQDDLKYAVINIGFTKHVKENKVPKLITNSTIICAKKIFPDDSNIVNQTMIDEVNQCIDQQITDAFIISEVYIKEVDKIRGPGKIIMQAIIVNCNENNTIKKQGITDYSETLQCIRKDMKSFREMIEKKIIEKQKQMGKAI